MLVYVDDMLLVGDIAIDIAAFKQFLNSKFHTKNLGDIRYFLELEVANIEQGLILCERKYALDLLEEFKPTNYMPLNLPLNPNVELHAKTGTPLYDPNRYKRLVGKLIYLSITRLDINFSVQLLS